MAATTYTVLLIDDHPLIAEAYKSAFTYLESHDQNVAFQIQTATDCDSACAILDKYVQSNTTLNIVFLDMRLPPSSDGTLLSGEDLGIRINEILPDTKVIVSTTFNDNYRVHSILKNINPDGFLVKNDLTPPELVQAIQVVLSDPPYYSKTVLKIMRNEVSNDYFIDDVDRKIMYQISIGTMTKDLPDIIHLSLAAIEKRKRQLKKILAIESSDDRELIFVAKEKGFI
ncbi:response regulator [Tenacibaculum agarivorans]|uniref:response regulator n=1 Tax=Tenacibaculum agarivorans TaxID=1908389 RepID=UPI00094BA651|nr:response regulator [Tenacibaculum agarivorans]